MGRGVWGAGGWCGVVGGGCGDGWFWLAGVGGCGVWVVMAGMP